jgi:hypothetical protein
MQFKLVELFNWKLKFIVYCTLFAMGHEHTMGESTCLKNKGSIQNFISLINLNKLTSNNGWTFTIYVFTLRKIKPKTLLQVVELFSLELNFFNLISCHCTCNEAWTYCKRVHMFQELRLNPQNFMPIISLH